MRSTAKRVRTVKMLLIRTKSRRFFENDSLSLKPRQHRAAATSEPTPTLKLSREISDDSLCSLSLSL